MKRCEHCGELIPADAKFCTKCGQEVKEVADRKLKEKKEKLHRLQNLQM